MQTTMSALLLVLQTASALVMSPAPALSRPAVACAASAPRAVAPVMIVEHADTFLQASDFLQSSNLLAVEEVLEEDLNALTPGGAIAILAIVVALAGLSLTAIRAVLVTLLEVVGPTLFNIAAFVILFELFGILPPP